MIDGEPGAGGYNYEAVETLDPVVLDCGCGCSVLKVEDIGDDLMMVGLYISTWDMYARSPWFMFKRRFIIAWQILRGKEYLAHSVLAPKEKFAHFAKELQKWQSNQ